MTTTVVQTRHSRWPHLPAAPWRYTGSGREVYQAVPGDPACPVQPGGSCSHCSTAITECHYFEATNTGERFKVGSTCIYKMFGETDSPSKSVSAAVREVKKLRNAKARERAAKNRASLKAEAHALLDATRGTAASVPHPNDWRAAKGDTLADWAEFLLANGGGPASKRVIAKLGELTR